MNSLCVSETLINWHATCHHHYRKWVKDKKGHFTQEITLYVKLLYSTTHLKFLLECLTQKVNISKIKLLIFLAQFSLSRPSTSHWSHLWLLSLKFTSNTSANPVSFNFNISPHYCHLDASRHDLASP